MPDSSTSLIKLTPAEDRLHWSLKVTSDVAGATGTLHGGCGLAASAAAMEAACDRPIVYISGQYLSRAPVGSDVTIEVEELAVGNRVTQAAASVTCGGAVVLRASAALGGHDLQIDRGWRQIPTVPSPEDCPRRQATSETGHSFTDYSDIRLAGQMPGEAAVYYWARLERGLTSSTAGLIALADLIPSGMRVSLGKAFRGSSLDHAVRITSLEESDWVLIRIEADAIRNSVGHGRAEIYSQSGSLLATGSQSFAISAITGPLDR
tara:strand:+ start:9863 stop:10654 length:792 start_codon:yes stop_codon:yes gene_type:complete